ncbi:hypothetical protein BpHYR1_029483 [Brachionus plicatilis]|uniref:Transmembrane protein n=1 Tax=Brachionus plicatilis TaxID=10195 RepID=A0A3M7S259_BRAPC|nr:hypothetical protein BpHYR1_029483 [Brachionus plicatilis]
MDMFKCLTNIQSWQHKPKSFEAVGFTVLGVIVLGVGLTNVATDCPSKRFKSLCLDFKTESVVSFGLETSCSKLFDSYLLSHSLVFSYQGDKIFSKLKIEKSKFVCYINLKSNNNFLQDRN